MVQHIKKGIFLILTIMVSSIAAAAFYQVALMGVSVSDDTVSAGDSLAFETEIVNRDDAPHTDLQVRALIQRMDDRSLVTSKTVREDVDLASREIISIDDEIEIPENTPDGSYSLILLAQTPNGPSISGASEAISVDNPEDVKSLSLGSDGVYLMTEQVSVSGDTITVRELPSYGTEGDTVLPGSSFDIRFDLRNNGDLPVDPTARIEIYSTYDDNEEVLKEQTVDLGTLTPGEERAHNLTSSMSEPGTYVIDTQIQDADGNQLTKGSVRLVIGGKSGSIVEVSNQQDTYDADEEVTVDATIVGPADGSTTVENAYLAVSALKDGQEVASKEMMVSELPLNPEERTISFATPENLEEYTLSVELGQGDQTFDTFEAEYRPLEAERKLTSDGRIQEAGQCFDDGTCTQAEYELGDCYDCRNRESPPEDISDSDEGEKEQKNDDESGSMGRFLTLIGGGLIIVTVITILYRRRS